MERPSTYSRDNIANAAISLCILLLTSCTMFIGLLEYRAESDFIPSILIHAGSTLLFIISVLIIMWPFAFFSTNSLNTAMERAFILSLRIAIGAILLKVLCATVLA